MLDYITSTLHSQPETAIGIAFLFAFVESLPFIGSLFPGMLTMPPIGWLIAKKVIPTLSTLSVILVGGMLGDYVGYFLGIFGKNILRKKFTASKNPYWFHAGERFVKKHGPLSIIIGRFIGPFRMLYSFICWYFWYASFSLYPCSNTVCITVGRGTPCAGCCHGII